MYVIDIEVILILYCLFDGQGFGDVCGFGYDRVMMFICVDIDIGEVGWGEVFVLGSVIVFVVDEFFCDDVVGMDFFDV